MNPAPKAKIIETKSSNRPLRIKVDSINPKPNGNRKERRAWLKLNRKLDN